MPDVAEVQSCADLRIGTIVLGSIGRIDSSRRYQHRAQGDPAERIWVDYRSALGHEPGMRAAMDEAAFVSQDHADVISVDVSDRAVRYLQTERPAYGMALDLHLGALAEGSPFLIGSPEEVVYAEKDTAVAFENCVVEFVRVEHRKTGSRYGERCGLCLDIATKYVKVNLSI